jgi:hypothetical protein
MQRTEGVGCLCFTGVEGELHGRGDPELSISYLVGKPGASPCWLKACVSLNTTFQGFSPNF